MNDQIEVLLSGLYPQKKLLKEGEFQFLQDTKISKLHNEGLKSCSSQWVFYKTSLQTAYFEFPNVDILIAMDTTNQGNIRVLKSLSFETPDPLFLEIFKNCRGITKSDKHQIAHSITSLLSSVAVVPIIKEQSSVKEDIIIFQISQSNGSYVDFEYTFNSQGILEQILCSGN